MTRQRVFMIVGLLFVLGLVVAVPIGTATAQTKEICDDKLDNDGDKLVDCADPDCATTEFCKTERAAACSPGYFKNHITAWCNVECPTGVIIAPTSCELLLGDEGLNATGPKNGVKKNIAASFINTTCFVTAEESPCEED